MERINEYLNRYLDVLVNYVPSLVQAILIFIIGSILIKFTKKVINNLMIKRDTDPTVSKFLMDLLTWAFRILLLISVIDQLGIESSSFVAIIGHVAIQ